MGEGSLSLWGRMGLLDQCNKRAVTEEERLGDFRVRPLRERSPHVDTSRVADDHRLDRKTVMYKSGTMAIAFALFTAVLLSGCSMHRVQAVAAPPVMAVTTLLEPRGQLQRQPLAKNLPGKLLSTNHGQSGILVIVHSVS